MKYLLILLCMISQICLSQNVIKCTIGEFEAYKHNIKLHAESKANSTELDCLTFVSPWSGTYKITSGTLLDRFCKNLNLSKEKFLSWKKETAGKEEMKNFRKEIDAKNPVFVQRSDYGWNLGEMTWAYWIDLACNPYILVNIDKITKLYLTESEIEKVCYLFNNADSLFANHPFVKMDAMLK